jgi:hypothetical protein
MRCRADGRVEESILYLLQPRNYENWNPRTRAAETTRADRARVLNLFCRNQKYSTAVDRSEILEHTAVCVHTRVYTAVDHILRTDNSGQEYRLMVVWSRTGISSFSLLKNIFLPGTYSCTKFQPVPYVPRYTRLTTSVHINLVDLCTVDLWVPLY